MEEKRKFIRYEKALEVRYSAKKRDAEIQGYSVSSNVSTGGICLPLSKHFKSGDTISLDIGAANNERVTAVGRIRWTKELKRLAPLQLMAGIEFTGLLPGELVAASS